MVRKNMKKDDIIRFIQEIREKKVKYVLDEYSGKPMKAEWVINTLKNVYNVKEEDICKELIKDERE